MHSYIFRKVEADEDINVQASHNWLNTGLSSHVEGYITALQKQDKQPKRLSRDVQKTQRSSHNTGYVENKRKRYSMYYDYEAALHCH